MKKCLFLLDAYMVSFPTWSENLGQYLNVYLLQATVELTGEHTRGQMVIEKRIGDIYVPKCWFDLRVSSQG